ncbi:hypothetical protein DFH09DRAFT_1397959 [Mycena vulgaris]|nr:hypothetical protein DFH09DRAFT_1397959 [Mycena vulgaris]
MPSDPRRSPSLNAHHLLEPQSHPRHRRLHQGPQLRSLSTASSDRAFLMSRPHPFLIECIMVDMRCVAPQPRRYTCSSAPTHPRQYSIASVDAAGDTHSCDQIVNESETVNGSRFNWVHGTRGSFPIVVAEASAPGAANPAFFLLRHPRPPARRIPASKTRSMRGPALVGVVVLPQWLTHGLHLNGGNGECVREGMESWAHGHVHI